MPFFSFTIHVWTEFRIRNPALTNAKTPMIKVLMFYMKLLPFLRVEMVRNRYLDIKRIFQSDINSDYWFNFEYNFLRDDNHIMKWSVATNCEDSRLILAINRHQEKQVLLIDEQLKPCGSNNDNLGNLIEGI